MLPQDAAPTSEVIELAHALYEHKALHTTHMRDEGERITDSLRETFAIGAEAQIPVSDFASQMQWSSQSRTLC